MTRNNEVGRWVRGIAVVLLVTGASGCSALSFINPRLPPPQNSEKGVLFRYHAASARVVQVAGNWPENNWLAGQAQTGSFRIGEMTDDDKDGVWERYEKLPPGRYQYKFRIDDVNWKDDPSNPQRADDGFGGFNSLLIVK
ncbi:MAG: glycogen-binding domain-containing protein [Candidatus Eisenbacteria bacterium]|nr:glycogen-binding domain-containing protein [Candidatus Eisenbacteria bacterium]